MDDKFHEECGVFGVCGDANAVMHTAIGLCALQHRGQESCGVAADDGREVTRVCSSGSPAALMSESAFGTLRGNLAVGHVRYSTVGDTGLQNAQPIVMDCPQGQMALCHNGQIVNFDELKEEIDPLGPIWRTTSDSELVLQLCRVSREKDAASAIVEAVARISGAFSMVLLANHELIVARDPHGFRPLCMGHLNDALVVCSETCALDAVGAQYIRDIEPGEITAIGAGGIRILRQSPAPTKTHCVFEHVYFARPDSYIFGVNVGAVRARLGSNLARESPVDADVIVPIPESGMWAALGYQEDSGLPLRLGLVRNPYMGRSFIHPDPDKRASITHLKVNAMPSVLGGKRVVLIDDSIVRGTTMTKIVELVRRAGATEVHVRIASPPPVAPCFYGINTSTTAELIAATQSVSAICRTIGADSLSYLSLQGLLDAVGHTHGDYCTACYTGNYGVRRPRTAGHHDFVGVQDIKRAA